MAAGAVKKVAELKRSTSTANDTPLCANIAFLRFLKNELTTANVINEAQLPVIARHISCLPSKELEKIPWTTMEPRKFQGLVSNLPKDLQSVVSIKAENVFIPKGIANINTLHKIVDVIVDPKKDINDWGLSDLFSFLKVAYIADLKAGKYENIKDRFSKLISERSLDSIFQVINFDLVKDDFIINFMPSWLDKSDYLRLVYSKEMRERGIASIVFQKRLRTAEKTPLSVSGSFSRDLV